MLTVAHSLPRKIWERFMKTAVLKCMGVWTTVILGVAVCWCYNVGFSKTAVSSSLSRTLLKHSITVTFYLRNVIKTYCQAEVLEADSMEKHFIATFAFQ